MLELFVKDFIQKHFEFNSLIETLAIQRAFSSTKSLIVLDSLNSILLCCKLLENYKINLIEVALLYFNWSTVSNVEAFYVESRTATTTLFEQTWRTSADKA